MKGGGIEARYREGGGELHTCMLHENSRTNNHDLHIHYASIMNIYSHSLTLSL